MVYLLFFQLNKRPHDVAWITASIFTLMTVTLSGEEIRKHLVNYSSPRVQKHIVRILWMPPIYALDCFIAIRFDSAGAYLTVVREMYEAYCVWSFMSLMMEFLHNVATLRRSIAEKGQAHTEEELATLEAQFLRYDADGDGFIDLEELGVLFQELSLNLTRAELMDVMDSFDQDGDGRLGREEFLQIMGDFPTTPGNFNRKRENHVEFAPDFFDFSIETFGIVGKSALKMTDRDIREAFSALDRVSLCFKYDDLPLKITGLHLTA